MVDRGSQLPGFLCLFAALLSGCSRAEPPAETAAAPADARVLRISQRNEPADLDPARASLPDEFFVIRALAEGLVAPLPLNASAAASGPRVEPAAAESWDVSPEGLTYTFHLRADARWSSGEPVTAHDFVASYRRLLAPATAAPKASLFFTVKNARAFATGALADFSAVGFRAPDARTLVVLLEYPVPEFLVYAASGPWIPANPRVVAAHGRSWTRPEHHVGNGPFTLAEWRPNQRIVVRRNPAYHATARVHLDEIHFLAFDSGDTEERAFRAGQVDVTMSVPFSKLDAYAREQPHELHRAPLAETRYVSFNTTRPPLDDARVRRALALAIDRAKITESVLRGGQQPAQSFVSPLLHPASDRIEGGRRVPSAPGTPPALAARSGVRALPGEAPAPDEPTAGDASFEPHMALATFDPELARQLLADAGYPNGRGFPRLELTAWGVTPQVLEALQQMWRKELGVQVSLVTQEARVHIAALREGRYDLALMTAIPDVPTAANLLADFTSAAPGNYPQWSDARFDALVIAATRAADPAERAQLLRAAESRLLEQCPLTPLYFNAVNWLMAPHVRGWQPDALWTRFYLDVELSAIPPRTE